jgi:hypothetical protein
MALPTAPISGISQNLFPYKVLNNFYKEWVKITPLSNFIGSEMTRPIYRHKLRDGEGLQFRVGRLEELDPTYSITGLDQRRGNEQEQKAVEDRVDVIFDSFGVKRKGKDIIRLGTPLKVFEEVRPQLIRRAARRLNLQLFNSMTTDLYPDTLTLKPSYDRLVIAGANNGKVATARGTYNGYAGLARALDDVGNPIYTASGLSANHLLQLRATASRGGADISKEHAIMPAYMKNRNNFPMDGWIYLMDPDSFPEILNDPKWMSTTMARGTVVDADQPQAIHGADYVGKFFGIHCYLVDDLSKYRLTSADGNKKIAWNLLIGAGAATIGWYEFPFIVMEMDEVDRIQRVWSHEQRGQKP